MCGRWANFTNLSPTFFLGTKSGDVMYLPDLSTKRLRSIWLVNDAPNRITGIAFLESPGFKSAIVTVENRVFLFITNSKLEFLFEEKYKRSVITGALPGVLASRFHLATINDHAKLGAFMSQGDATGVLTITITPGRSLEGGGTLRQHWFEFPLPGVRFLHMTDFGTFIGKDTTVEFHSELDFSVRLELSDVRAISTVGDELWFHFTSHIDHLTVSSFRLQLFSEAMRTGNHRYAAAVATDDDSRRAALSRVLPSLSRKAASAFLHSLEWSIRRVMSVVEPHSPSLLPYLKGLEPPNPALCHLIFELHALHFPRWRRGFASFLEGYGAFLHDDTVYTRLREVGFAAGMLRFAAARAAVRRQVSLLVGAGDFAGVVGLLSKIEDRREFVQVARALLRTGVREQAIQAIGRCDRHPPGTIVPVLVEAPECVAGLWHDRRNVAPPITALLVVAMSRMRSDDAVLELVESDGPRMLALRFCRQNGCVRGAARILVALGMPEAAVETLYGAMGVGHVHALLAQIEGDAMKRRGFLRLLKIEGARDRAETLAMLAEGAILDFEELAEFVDDERPFAAVENQFLSFVEKIEETAMIGQWQKKFPEVERTSFVIGLDDKCDVCHASVFGGEFVRWPCGHVVHTDCMSAVIADLGEALPDRTVEVTESCPICGFLAV
jgi:hypothetical protein